VPTKCSILSIVPYRVLPATSGGHLGIVQLHDAIGKICPDNIAGTVDNGSDDHYSFTLHKIFTAGASRYVPFKYFRRLKGLIKTYGSNNIYCDHPYMMPTAISLSKELRIPLYMRSHNIESERFRTLEKKWWRGMYWFEQYSMRSATGVFFVTPEDAEWAMEYYKLSPSKCHVIPFGTPIAETPVEHTAAKKLLTKELNIPEHKPLLYFLGALDYYPNIQAVNFILDEIMPRLDGANKDYEILIAGKGLPLAIQKRIEATERIRYLGFVPSLDTFLNGSNVMLNPVLLGGGIKTKAVEALGHNKMVVSTYSGAAGLIREACGGNLLVAADDDWDDFVQKIVTAMQSIPKIPGAFYETYNWDKIARKVVDIMEQDTTQLSR
jgi:glycosyltransferase involved in cell wall biosynthesis